MKNEFVKTSACAERLFKEYNKHKKLVVAVDYDSTLFPWNQNDGTDFSDTIEVVKEAQKRGFYIVIWTASIATRYPEIAKYCESKGIKVDAINENVIDIPYGKNKKIYYNILLDDRAGLGQAIDILKTLFKLIDEKPI